MDNVFNFAKQLIEKANRVILKSYDKIRTISYKKGDFNLVTNVDHEVEALILKEINSKYPDHSIVAEESGIHTKNLKYQWFIDPIDGTTNFAHGYPCFCISIGFSVNNILEFGLIKNPLTDELYSARKNKGAKLNRKVISVSKIKTLRDSLLVTGFSYDRKNPKTNNFNNFRNLTLVSQGVRRDGAAALDLCYVASGKVDGFWELKLSPWDVAAGALILKEAGGKITKFKGKKYDLYSKEIVATNGFIHSELIKHLK
ncbi:MAG: inositol monophosphatase [Candidatus Melainabacteria bacterium]|nr:inositol monophosphatase [Candidatus Melainabacteria bacterium]